MQLSRQAALFAAVAAVSSSVVSSIAWGVDRTWDGFFTNSFTQDTNWTQNIAPGVGDAARFRNQSGASTAALVILGVNHQVAEMTVDGIPAAGAYVFRQTGNSLLTVTGNVEMGNGGLGATPVTFDGFRVSSGGNLSMGNGTLNLIGGAQATVGGQFDTFAGGVINVGPATVNCQTIAVFGTSSININNGGSVTVGTGALQLSDAGSRININSGGALAFNGFSALFGGTLTLNAGGTLNIGASELDTDGAAHIQFNRDFVLGNGKTLNIKQGGDLASTSFLDIGSGGQGTLLVNGLGSTVSIGTASSTFSDWGRSGGTATVTFSNSATGDYNAGLQIADSGSAATSARVRIESGSSLNVDNFLRVGGVGPASITINNATLTSTGTSQFGAGTAVALESGTLSFGGNATFLTGSTLNRTGGNLVVAAGRTLAFDGGTGTHSGGIFFLNNGQTLRVANAGGAGGQFTAPTVNIASAGGTSGSILVDGANSRFASTDTGGNTAWGQGGAATATFSNGGAGTLANQLQLGSGGTAVLNLQSGGSLRVPSLTTTFAGGSATINVAGGTLDIAGGANFNNNARVNLSAGGLVLGGNTTFALGSSLTQTGADGGTFVMPQNATLDFNGGTALLERAAIPNGTSVRITNGGKVEVSDSLDVAFNRSTGTLLVDGGTSTFQIIPGSPNNWGFGSGNRADVTFSNGATGNLFSLGTRIDMGTSGGIAKLDVLSGAKLNLREIRTGEGGGSTTINVNNATLTTAGTSLFQSTTVLNLQTNGSINFGGNTTFNSGSTFNWTGGVWGTAAGTTLAFEGGAGSFTGGGVGVFGGTTLRITGGGTLVTNNRFDIARPASPTTATMLVAGPGSSFTSTAGSGSFSTWSNVPGQTATITFSGAGVGSYNAGLQIGPGGGGATVNIESTAQLNTASLVAGRTTAGASDGVNINVNGGRLNIVGAASFHTGAKLNLQTAGSVNFGGNTTFNTGSTFNWSGGTWNNAAGTTIAFEGGAGSFTVGGDPGGKGLSNGSTLRIAGGGTLVSNSYLDIGNDFFPGVTSGTMIVTNPGSSFTSSGLDSVWSRSAGTDATITFSDSGVGSYNAGLLIGQTGGAATVNLQSSGRLNTASLSAGRVDNPSDGVNINVNGGILNIAGAASFNNGANLNLQTGGSVNFGGNTTFNTGSTFNWSGGTWNNADGTTIAFEGGAGSFTGGEAVVGRGLSNGSTLRIGPGGSLKTDSFFDIANGSGTFTGSMIVDGGLFEATSTVAGTDTLWGHNPNNLATITIMNAGTAMYGRGVSIGNSGGGGTVNLQSGGQLRTGFFQVATSRVNIAGGALVVTNGAATAGFGNGAVVNYSAGSFTVAGTLNMSGNSQINFTAGGAPKTMHVGRLSMSGTSKIDLANHEMLVDYIGAPAPAVDQIRQLIATGHNGGDWLGNRITSSTAQTVAGTALGYDDLGNAFLGNPTIRILYTLYGDADLSRTVDIGDFARLAANFNAPSFWDKGDFNYNGTTEIGDFALLAANFNRSLPADLPRSAVPEPMSAMAVITAAVLMNRRRNC